MVRHTLSHTLHVSSTRREEFFTLLLLQMIKMGSDVEVVLRETVLQMEHKEDNTLCMILFFSFLKI